MRRLLHQVLCGRIRSETGESDLSQPHHARRRSLLAPSAIVAAGAVLAGCAVPPAVVVATQAMDGVSYLTTGKSSTDHLLSAALKEDCALHRVISGVAVCQAEGVDVVSGDGAATVQVASLADTAADTALADDTVNDSAARTMTTVTLPSDADAEQAAQKDPVPGAVAGMGLGADTFFAPHPNSAPVPARKMPVTDDTAPLPDAAAPDVKAERPSTSAMAGKVESALAPQAAALAPIVPPEKPSALPAARGSAAQEALRTVEAPRYFVVLGSFTDRTNAERAAGGGTDGAAIATARVLGRIYYRVVSGPFDGASLHQRRDDYARAGFPGAWPAPVCATMKSDGCIVLD